MASLTKRTGQNKAVQQNDGYITISSDDDDDPDMHPNKKASTSTHINISGSAASGRSLFILLIAFWMSLKFYGQLQDPVRSNPLHVVVQEDPPPQEENRDDWVVPPQCSASQMAALKKKFHTSIMYKDPAKVSWRTRIQTPLMKATKCPEEPWIDAYFAKQTQSSYLGINVGCNKGLDAVAMARVLSRNPQLSPNTWKSALGRTSRAACGIPTTAAIPSNATMATGQVHCIEPMPSTVRTLQKALDTTGYSDHVVIQPVVMSNTTGQGLFPNGGSGKEAYSLADCLRDPPTTNCTKVPMYSLDDFMHDKINNPKAMIDILLIDAEGFDYEVLQGAAETFNRVRYLSFEVHMNGNWMSHSLIHAITTTLADFNCYWAGRNRLWRINQCWNDDLAKIYEFKSWSNVACVHQRETELATIMEEVFQKTLS